MLRFPSFPASATVAFALLALLPPAASAGVIFYTSEAAFLAAISNPGVDTFDDLPLGAMGSPITRTAGSYGYQAATSVSTFYNIGSGSDIWLSPDFATAVITFSSFTGGVYGAGAYLFATDEDGGLIFIPEIPIYVSVTDSSGTYNSSIVAAPTPVFLGWVSDLGLLSFSVSASQDTGSPWPTVNDLVLGGNAAAIPEPSTVALSALGLLVLAVAPFRRKR
jgi:hypothetical protein